MPARLKTYYRLTKPGIVYGNLLTGAAGFLLASRGHLNFSLLLATLLGLALVVASGCVFNNYLDRGLDARMARTQRRALVVGDVTGLAALVYAAVLLGLGIVVLILGSTGLALVTALFGFVMYVIVYGYFKRRSVFGTEVGSVSGAIPPVVGYVAVTDRLDLGAFLLFAIMVLWQMPHFYAITIYRLGDYSAAGLPVLPVKRGVGHAKVRLVVYVAAFIVAAAALSLTGYTGLTFLIMVCALGSLWLALGLRGFRTADDTRWARLMFLMSLAVISVMCLAIALS